MSNLYILKSFRDYHPLFNRVFASRNAFRCSSKKSDENKSGDSVIEENKSDEKNKPEKSVDKLNKLLLQLANTSVTEKAKLNLAKPTTKRKGPTVSEQKLEPEVKFEKRLESAAKDVAQSLGGEEKRVESELLSKLLNLSAKDDAHPVVQLSSIVKGMKIDRESKSTEQVSRAEQVRQLLSRSKRSEVKTKSFPTKIERRVRTETPIQGNIEKVNIFEAEPLGLFRKDLKDEGIPTNKWKILYEKELQLAVTHPPSNYFQQMIQWTEAGKIWKFPIDNEQGMEEEHKIYFTEHVFLEKHLEPWCPPKGPVRHFMELVCVGLSKNPYMTVETKKEHIEWYKKYFEDKIQILKETGAIPDKSISEMKEH